METRDYLFELGTEELPPKALMQLSEALEQHIVAGLDKAELTFSSTKAFASPRRLAVQVSGLLAKQPPRQLVRTGPSVKAAYVHDGTPSLALMGFARSCGASLDQIEMVTTDKGDYVQCKIHKAGASAAELLPEIIMHAMKKLPIPKPMRWGDRDDSFIRPVHWMVSLFGTQVVPFKLFGLEASRMTFGHRFMAPQAIELKHASEYSFRLKEEGKVIADFATRKQQIERGLRQITSSVGNVVIDPALLDEVTALVEWPVPLLGEFNPAFLNVPKEALITSMKSHQKVFPVQDTEQQLLPYFALISNIESTNPELVVKGNERVIAARLSDAAFFYQQDQKTSLMKRGQRLAHIIFTKKLGSLADRTHRMGLLSAYIAKQIGSDVTQAKHAAQLSKCDLVTEMVGEFPSLQGIMGYYYALNDGETPSVAKAIREQYQPKFAGDVIPASDLGACVALAEKIDTLVGIIGIKQMPSGDKDPFALRRAALGVMRILIETPLALDLVDLIHYSAKNYRDLLTNDQVETQVYQFCMDRLRAWYQDKGVETQTIAAVMALNPRSPLDFDRRIHAVQGFMALDEAQALAAANKRVKNILKKQHDVTLPDSIDRSLFETDAEILLADALSDTTAAIKSLSLDADYNQMLKNLATLKTPVDRFFDEVMIMADDIRLRNNRLLLLSQLRALFTQVADISLLQ